MIEIKPHGVMDCCLSVPGSKSYSHRALICAALCNELCILSDMLASQDITMTSLALKKLGVAIRYFENDVIVLGLGGRFKPCNLPIYLGNSGTSMRFLTGLVALGTGWYTLVGTERMHKRPMRHLINAMNRLGFTVYSLYDNGCPPIKILGSKTVIEAIEIDCSVSSQYLSSLLLIAPFFRDGLNVTVTGEIVSDPYINMTIAVMKRFGVYVERETYTSFNVPGGQSYTATSYSVEPDCSHACYFWAAAAITGGRVTVEGLNLDSKQGDIKFLNILKKMGCFVHTDQVGITVIGRALRGVTADMSDMPDVVPTLAVVASFCKGSTEINGISHLKTKESDRIMAITKELRRMGVFVETNGDKIIVKGGVPRGAVIHTHDDHRIAMSFALAGLKIPGIKIREETCVIKSFPEFWKTFEMLYTF